MRPSHLVPLAVCALVPSIIVGCGSSSGEQTNATVAYAPRSSDGQEGATTTFDGDGGLDSASANADACGASPSRCGDPRKDASADASDGESHAPDGSASPADSGPVAIDGGPGALDSGAQPPAPWIPATRYGTTFTVRLHCNESWHHTGCDTPDFRNRSGDQTVSVTVALRGADTYFDVGSLSTYGVGPSIPGDSALFDGNGVASASYTLNTPAKRINRRHTVKLESGELKVQAYIDTWDQGVCSGAHYATNNCYGSIPWDGYAPAP